MSFLANPKYVKQLETTQASAVVAGLNVTSDRVEALLRANDPYYSFTQAVVILHGHRKHPPGGASPAHVDPTATVGEGTVIYPGCYVGPGVRIGRTAFCIRMWWCMRSVSGTA